VIDFTEKENMRMSLNQSFKNIMTNWRARAHRRIQIKSQVAGILELLSEPECVFCGRSWGLKCESIDNVEDVFVRFLMSRGLTFYGSWEPRDWQEYYRENSNFRTICYSCHEQIAPKNQVAPINRIADIVQNLFANTQEM
jgi:hypothetical protein